MIKLLKQGLLQIPQTISQLGVVGLNMRNGKYLLPNNDRKYYRLVDDKLITKKLALEAGLSVPPLYGSLQNPSELKGLKTILSTHRSFVIKPSRGSGGKGVLVIQDRKGNRFLKPSGDSLSLDDIRFHSANILGGLYSLGGQRDAAMIEACIYPIKTLTKISYQGAPDIRVIMLHGYPVMAMLRVATRSSDGRANLHQGAIGIGVNLVSGETCYAVMHGQPIEAHPDLDLSLLGHQIPYWQKVLQMSSRCYDVVKLGYLGVDLMIDREHGPMILEVNARPGLAIQLANGKGLRFRLDAVAKEVKKREQPATLEERITFIKKLEHSNNVKKT